MNDKMKTKEDDRKREGIPIEHLADLEPYTDDIITKFNSDKKLALLAVVDPVGVLEDFGYTLSRKAARNLQRSLPRPTGEARDRYINWLRDLESIPNTIDIKLSRRPSGRDLLQGSTNQQTSSLNAGPGKGAAGFDIVAQFGESLCDRLLKRNYAYSRLPRSVYRIGGKLYYFVDSGDYEDMKKSFGKPDREIHFGLPSLKFQTTSPDTVRVSSPFIATGFGPSKIKGTVTVEGKLTLRKDSQGYPHYIEVTYDKLTSAGVSFSFSSPPQNLTSVFRDAYKEFSKASLFPKDPRAPITYTFVDSAAMPSGGASTKLTTAFAVKKPKGAQSSILIVGFNRVGHKGNLNVVPNYIKPGGDYALVQDAKWLEQMFNTSFTKLLPLRFDSDNGKLDKNGDMKINSVNWRYRKGGLTGDVSGVQENAFLGINADVSGEAFMHMKFRTSDPKLDLESGASVEGEIGEGMICLIIFIALLAALIGAIIGGIIAGVILGLGAEAVIATAVLGGIIGFGAGVAGALACLGALSYDPSGMQSSSQQSSKQTIKLTHDQSLPGILGSVKVMPNGFEVSELGTFLSAKVIGPDYMVSQPLVRIHGSYTVDIDKQYYGADSITSGSGSGGMASGEVSTQKPSHESLRVDISSAGLQKTGTISMHYKVTLTKGLQGALAYTWIFNGKPVGNASTVKVDVPIPADVIAGLQHNEVNILGLLKVTVKDTFGRTATDSVSIQVGRKIDLRAFAPQTLSKPGFVDPSDVLGGVDPLDLVSRVGWAQNGTDLATSEGELAAFTTFYSPVSRQTLAVIGVSHKLT